MIIYLIIALATILSLIISLTYFTLSYLTQNGWLILLAIALLLFKFARFLCKALVFPGAFALYRRINQNAHATFRAKKWIERYKLFESLLKADTLKPGDPRILQFLQSFFLHYSLFQEMRNLSPHQQDLFTMITNLANLLDSTQDSIKLSQLLLSGVKPSASVLEALFYYTASLQRILVGQVETLPLVPNARRWLNLDLLGTAQELRLEILRATGGKRLFVKAPQGHKLDCLIIGQNQDRPTVLFCNPNGGLYEYMFFDSTWFQFYQESQFNLILWNYPQYGESEGKCSTDALISDACFLVQRFRQGMKFGIHGYSLGGGIAQTVARRMNLDFLVVDRSFSSLGQVASKWLSGKARFALNLFTLWDQFHYLDYYKYKGIKVIIQDPKDEVIPYEAQLASGTMRLCLTGGQEHSIWDYFADREDLKYRQFFYQKVLSRKELEKLVALLRNFEEQTKQTLMAEVDEEGQLIDEEQETQDTRFKQMRSIHGSSNAAEYIERFHDLLRIVDYQNVSLVHLLSEDINEGQVIIFFGMVAVFDEHLEERSKEFAAAANQLEETIPGNKALEKLMGECRQIQQYFQKILGNLETLVPTVDRERCGVLFTVRCGHNYNLTEPEQSSFQELMFKLLLR